jgi:hypothetical protein
MADIVYILTNPVMPDLVKIGRTTNLQERLRSLSTHSGVPVPFEVFYACEVADAARVERHIHDGFGDHRINPKREFFRINPERVLAILKLVEIQDLTPSEDVVEDEAEQDSLNRERNRRTSFRFSLVGLMPGTTLTFLRDETIQAKVLDDRAIEFEGQVTSLSSSALKVLQQRFGYKGRTVEGPRYWCHDGRTLSELRQSLEHTDE